MVEYISFIKKKLSNDKILTCGRATMLEAESKFGPFYTKSKSLRVGGKEFASRGIFAVTDKHLIFINLFQIKASSILIIISVIFLLLGVIGYYFMQNLDIFILLLIWAFGCAIIGYIVKIFNFMIWPRSTLEELQLHKYSKKVSIDGKLKYGYAKVRIRIDENADEIISSLSSDYKEIFVKDSNNLPHKHFLTKQHKFIIYSAIIVTLIVVVFVIHNM